MEELKDKLAELLDTHDVQTVVTALADVLDDAAKYVAIVCDNANECQERITTALQKVKP